MLIDNTLQKRWGLIPNQIGSSSDEELIDEKDLRGAVTSGLETRHRFRVSAKEWLSTWRIIE